MEQKKNFQYQKKKAIYLMDGMTIANLQEKKQKQ